MSDNTRDIINKWDTEENGVKRSGYIVRERDGGTTARVDLKKGNIAVGMIDSRMLDSKTGTYDGVQGWVSIHKNDPAQLGEILREQFGVRYDAASEYEKQAKLSFHTPDGKYTTITDPDTLKAVEPILRKLAEKGKDLTLDDAATLANLAADLQDDGKLNKSAPDVRARYPELKQR
jgi:hypothetical protein